MSLESIFTKKSIGYKDHTRRRSRLASKSLDEANFAELLRDEEVDFGGSSPESFRESRNVWLSSSPVKKEDIPRFDMMCLFDADMAVYGDFNDDELSMIMRQSIRGYTNVSVSSDKLNDWAEVQSDGDAPAIENRFSGDNGVHAMPDEDVIVGGNISQGFLNILKRGGNFPTYKDVLTSKKKTTFEEDVNSSEHETTFEEDVKTGKSALDRVHSTKDDQDFSSVELSKMSLSCLTTSSISSISTSSYDNSSAWSTISSSPLLVSSPLIPEKGFSLFLPYSPQTNGNGHVASKIGPIPECPLFSRREFCRSDCPFVHKGNCNTENVARKLEFDDSFIEERDDDDKVQVLFELAVDNFPSPKLLSPWEYFEHLVMSSSEEETAIRRKGPYAANDLLDCDACYPSESSLFEFMEKKAQKEMQIERLFKAFLG